MWRQSFTFTHVHTYIIHTRSPCCLGKACLVVVTVILFFSSSFRLGPSGTMFLPLCWCSWCSWCRGSCFSSRAGASGARGARGAAVLGGYKQDCELRTASTHPLRRPLSPHFLCVLPCWCAGVLVRGREYPLDWITRQMKRSGMVVTAAKKMPVLYAPHTVKRQVRKTPRRLFRRR